MPAPSKRKVTASHQALSHQVFRHFPCKPGLIWDSPVRVGRTSHVDTRPQGTHWPGGVSGHRKAVPDVQQSISFQWPCALPIHTCHDNRGLKYCRY